MGKLEEEVKADIRLESSQRGIPLLRNNVGVCTDENGRPVRYGLANDSKKVNKEYKSGDLIGILPIIITPEMVGTKIGQFLSVEVKRSKWEWSGSPREMAQLRWARYVQAQGGCAGIVNSVDEFKALVGY